MTKGKRKLLGVRAIFVFLILVISSQVCTHISKFARWCSKICAVYYIRFHLSEVLKIIL